MPIYEFACERCGERFDALVDRGTESVECRLCGAPATERVLSAPAPSMHLVKTRGEARKQEGKNAELHRTTKARYKATRDAQRARAKQRGKPK